MVYYLAGVIVLLTQFFTLCISLNHLQHVILKVKTGLEGLVAMRAGKRPNVVVD